jgi:hypothetical protein
MKKLIYQIFTIAIVGLLYFNCQVNNFRIDDNRDKEEAQKITDRFFMYFHAKEYNGTYELLGKQLIADSVKLKTLLFDINEKFGKIKNYSVTQWQTKVVSGTNPSGQYHIVYFNTYEKGNLTEDFLLRLEKDNSIKIVGYHVTADKL